MSDEQQEVSKTEKTPETVKNDKYDYKKNLPNSTKQYTQNELDRLKKSLNAEAAKIQYSKRKDFQPFVFNGLDPYRNLYDSEYLLKTPEVFPPFVYQNRYTAMNIVEPWVAHRMDNSITPQLAHPKPT